MFDFDDLDQRLPEASSPPNTGMAPDYICWLGGPVLLTAPHSSAMIRAGKWKAREKCTAEIAVSLARELRRMGLPASFMVWDPSRFDEARLDPNVLTQALLQASPYHRALHKWASIGRRHREALLHIDLHGKVSEVLHLDVGVRPLEAEWRTERQFADSLKTKIRTVLGNCLQSNRVCHFDGAGVGVETEPWMHGYWGDERMTMSHQSVLLGIPAVQFEMPPGMRWKLFPREASSRDFVQSFAGAIKETYEEIVVPRWAEHAAAGTNFPQFLALSDQLAVDVIEQGHADMNEFEQWATQLIDQLLRQDMALSSLGDEQRHHRGDFRIR